MGLDMYLDGEKYLWTDHLNPENNLREDGYRVKARTVELGYWRKHPNLHHAKDSCHNCRPARVFGASSTQGG